MAPRNKHEPHLALAAAAIADAFECRANSRPEAGPCPHPYQDVPGTAPGRLGRGEMGRALLLQDMAFAAATYQRWWGQVGLGPEYQGAPVGGVRAKPSALHPPAHSNC